MTDLPSVGTIFPIVILIVDNQGHLTHMPRILALDGGGIRGLSSLLILEKLMREVQRSKGGSSDDDPPLPCEYFDLICGTSTGGLIAIMLGRLRMVNRHKTLGIN